jgi:hypothetical protein
VHLYLTDTMSVQHINWLRAKARHQRWDEEITIVKNEMIWTQLWFGHQVRVWEERRQAASASMSQGHQVYAAKQAWVWRSFLDDASKAFAGNNIV